MLSKSVVAHKVMLCLTSFLNVVSNTAGHDELRDKSCMHSGSLFIRVPSEIYSSSLLS